MSINKIDKLTGEATPICGGTMYADSPIGTIFAFSSTITPRDFLPCDGRAISRTTYAELYSVIGVSYGSGDGVNTFNVPDLRETVPVGIGENGTATIAEHDVYTLGEFKDDQLKDHYHGVRTLGTSDQYTINASRPDANTSGVKGWGNPWGTQFNPATTTHGKQLGVNYIIKAKSTAVPYDYKEYIDNKLEEGGFDAPFNLKEYIQNQNILSDYETASAQFTAEYDGFISAGVAGTGVGVEIKINGVLVATNSNADYGINSVSALFKKGDVVVTTSSTPKVAYYKLRDYSGR